MVLLASILGSSYQVQKKSEERCAAENRSAVSSLQTIHSRSEDERWQGTMCFSTVSFLSVLYLIIVSLLGSAILLSELGHHYQYSQNVHGVLMVLMFSSSFWMAWFICYSRKQKNLWKYEDHQAGARWMKGGLCFFALATLVLDCLYLGYFSESFHCTSILMVAYPVTQALFTMIQVSFLSFNAKVCIQDQPNINRFGLMHTIATNILVWMSRVLDESAEQLKELYHVNKTVGQAILQDSQYTNSCECFTKACYVFREGSIYLYPFNIEFSLFSSVMLYIMWKNVERVPHVDEFVKTKRRAVSFNGILIGLVFGVLVLLSTFGVMILSGVHAKKSEILPYYSFDSGLLFTMFVASVTGIATNQHRKNDSASKRPKSVVRNVDISLLLGSSCGPLMGSVFSLVSFFFCQVRDYFNFLDFCLSVCRIVQLLAQNLFIAEALYSVPNGLESEEKESLVFSISQSAHSFVFHHGVCNEGFDDTTENFSCLAKEQNSDISTSQEFKTLSSLHKPDCSFIPRISQTDDIFQLREIKESRVLKKNLIPNISVFLIFCNISVWILCAYLIRPHLHSQIEQKFYGSTLWAIIENISLPLGIFYHMHSVASLFEVYCRS